MAEDPKRIEFVNNVLREYLANDKYKSYSKLIEATLQDNVSMGAKYNLWTLFMNFGTAKLTASQLSERLCEVYKSDKNIEEYINKIVSYNPKLNYISIQASSRMDMKDDHNLDIHVSVNSGSSLEEQFENADRITTKIKEVLTMILFESKSIS